MRKFITIGISAIAAGSIFLTAAGPSAIAQTTTTTTVPNTIVDDVCLAIPGALTSVTDAIAALAALTDEVDYAAAKSAAQTATTAFVSALVNYLQDVADQSSDLPISTSTLTVRQGQYVDALTAWGESAASKTQNWGMSELLAAQNAALAQLGVGLACPPVVV